MDFFAAWQERIQAAASMQSYQAGWLDGMTEGNPSFFVKHLAGQDLKDYYDGFREGVQSFFRREPWSPKLSAAEDPWDDEMVFEAREKVTPTERPEMPESPEWGHMLAPHANPKNVRANPHATEMSRLPEDEQERQRTKIQAHAPEGVDMSHEGIVGRLMDLHHQYHSDPDLHDAYHAGGTFYHEAHNWVGGLAEHPHLASHDDRHRRVAGALAALSPGTEWENNKTQTSHLVNHFNQRQYQGMHPYDAAQKYWEKLGPGNRAGIARNTVSNYAKAFHILRGGDVDEHLGGHKVRSFFNNIIDPHNHAGRNDLTMDRHAVSAATGGTLGPERLNAMFYGYRHKDPSTGEITQGAMGSSAKHNTVGTYAHIADAYREAHRRLTDQGEDAGAHPSDFQAKVWGVWRGQAFQNHRRGEEGRNMPHYAEKHPEPINDFGEPIDTWGGPSDEPDPDISPEENDAYWAEHYNDHRTAARTNRSATDTSADFGKTPEITEQGYDPDPAKDALPDHPERSVFASLVPHHLKKGWDEFAFEGVLEAEPVPALPWTEAEADPFEHKDAQPRTNWVDAPYSSHTMAARQEVCRHCERPITQDEHGTWVDPHAHGDDSIWRETCDSHDTFSAEHEPKPPSNPHLHRPFVLDHRDLVSTNALQAEADLNDLQQRNPGKDTELGDEYREDHEGDPNPSQWWQQQHSTSADNPASTGPSTFGDTLDPGYYPLVHGQETPDERLLDPTGKPLTSSNFGANFEFNGSLQPSGDASSRSWLMEGVSEGAAPPPPPSAETTAGTGAKAGRLESYVPLQDAGGTALPAGVTQPEWLSRGASAAPGGAGGPQGNHSDSDIAKAARAHLAALSISEQHELITEGAEDGRVASNYDRLRLGGTHYLALEAQLQAQEEDAEDLFY